MLTAEAGVVGRLRATPHYFSQLVLRHYPQPRDLEFLSRLLRTVCVVTGPQSCQSQSHSCKDIYYNLLVDTADLARFGSLSEDNVATEKTGNEGIIRTYSMLVSNRSDSGSTCLRTLYTFLARCGTVFLEKQTGCLVYEGELGQVPSMRAISTEHKPYFLSESSCRVSIRRDPARP